MLGLAGTRRAGDPLGLAGQGLLAGLLLALLQGQALLLLCQPAGVVAFEGEALAAIELEDPAGDVVEEVAVVGDGDDGALVVVEEAFEPGDGFGVEVVGGLVEEEEVGLREEKAAECDAAALAAGEGGDVGIAGWAAQRVHGDLEGALDLPAIAGVDLLLQLGLLGHERVHVGVGVGEAFGDGIEAVEQRLGLADAFHDVAEHVLGVVEMRLLLEVADLDAVGGPGLAVEVGVAAGHDLQEARFARAVDAQDADLGAGEEGQGDVLEQLLATGENLGELLHDEDVLIGGHRRPSCGREIR